RRPRTAAEVVDAFERTWAAISGCFARWTPADLKVTYSRKLRTAGEQVRSREWVIWHLIEHELHHGGEISNILGSNGMAAPDL
ncbi:MAG: DinB family protein, partial [Dehalococcoidia bacterium]|nr:DinB family protein [Dehalococcoidia bacterium]